MRNTDILKAIFLICAVLVGCSKDDDSPAIARKGTSGSIITIAGRGPSAFGHEGDGGKARSAKLGWVIGVSVDASNHVYVADGAANTIRKITFPFEVITTIAGKFIGFNVPDLTPAGNDIPATSARLDIPVATDVDAAGNIFIAELSSFLIREVTATDGLIKTVAGKSNVYDYPGDGNPATTVGIWSPGCVVVDAAGNLFYSDRQNNAVRIVSKATGKVTTIAGLGPDESGYSGDHGPAKEARLNMPEGIALDNSGNLYIADAGNGVIRKVFNGTITTVAGTGSSGYSGDGGPATAATFSSLHGIAVDNDGNIYVADAGNSVIRKITIASGIITTVAGNGTAGYSGDGGRATQAQLSGPWGVDVDAAGNIYIADSQNAAIRMVVR